MESSFQDHSETGTLDTKATRLNDIIERLRMEQNLPMAVLAGLLAALVAAALWAIVTITTNFQIGFMAIGVGFLVGVSVRAAGKGLDKIFGITGAILSLLGCLAGNFFSVIGFIAQANGWGYFQTLNAVDLTVIPGLMTESFSLMDLFFYSIAVYEGYKFSFTPMDKKDISG